MTLTAEHPPGSPPLAARSDDPGAARRTRLVLGMAVSLLALAVVAALSLALGSKNIEPSVVWQALRGHASGLDAVLVRELRIPRTLLGILAGAALGLSGALMQALTRNPLADPGILGITSGASLGVVLAIAYLGVSTLSGYVWTALLGAGLATIAGYAVGSAGRGGASPIRLALAGAAITAVMTGFISAVVLTNHGAFSGWRAWSVGSLADRNMGVVTQVAPFIIVGVGMTLAMPRALNALALGDDTARALGAKVGLIRVVGVVASTLMCGAATAAIGPIGFVGLVVPHAVRAFTGADNRWLMAYTSVLGPLLVLGADVLGRVVIHPQELQAAIITALVGAPVFIFLVRRRQIAEL